MDYVYGARKRGAVTTADGAVIFPATFRYKPFSGWDSQAVNRRMDRLSGVDRVRRAFAGQMVLAAITSGTGGFAKGQQYSVYKAAEGLFRDESGTLVGTLSYEGGAWRVSPMPGREATP